VHVDSILSTCASEQASLDAFFWTMKELFVIKLNSTLLSAQQLVEFLAFYAMFVVHLILKTIHLSSGMLAFSLSSVPSIHQITKLSNKKIQLISNVCERKVCLIQQQL